MKSFLALRLPVKAGWECPQVREMASQPRRSGRSSRRDASSLTKSGPCANPHILHARVEAGTQIRLSPHAGAVAWREDLEVSPADGVGGSFQFLVSCPPQMQAAG